MLMASEKGAKLIVSVGAHFNLVEFLDKQRSGMSSTFLTRLRIGETLVDAKGVSRLYNPGLGIPDMAPSLGLPRCCDRRAHHAGARTVRAALAEDQGLAARGHPSSLGYSARYHAASLVAVFLALAVGILIGAGLGDDLVSGASRTSRESLGSDIEERRGEGRRPGGPARPRAELRLAGLSGAGRRPRGADRSLAFGDLPDERDRHGAPRASSRRRRAGRGRRGGPAARRRGAAGSGWRSQAAPRRGALDAIGDAIGRQLVGGGTLLERMRDNLFSRSSGSGGHRRIVVVRATPES